MISIHEIVQAIGMDEVGEGHYLGIRNELLYHVFISPRRSGKSRIEVFVQSGAHEDDVIGGTLTPSSILQGGSVGPDCHWWGEINALPADEAASAALRQLAYPLFAEVQSTSLLHELRDEYQTQ